MSMRGLVRGNTPRDVSGNAMRCLAHVYSPRDVSGDAMRSLVRGYRRRDASGGAQRRPALRDSSWLARHGPDREYLHPCVGWP